MIEIGKDQSVGMCFIPAQNPWGRISDIAAKVGVQPMTDRHNATITAMGVDGNAYDLWEVIAAVLDRLERAAE